MDLKAPVHHPQGFAGVPQLVISLPHHLVGPPFPWVDLDGGLEILDGFGVLPALVQTQTPVVVIAGGRGPNRASQKQEQKNGFQVLDVFHPSSISGIQRVIGIVIKT
jgi:hypothetical protein